MKSSRASLSPLTSAGNPQEATISEASALGMPYAEDRLLARVLRRIANAARTALLRAENGSPALNGAGRQFSVYRTETDAALLGEAARRLSQVRYVTFGSAGGARALLGAAALPKEVRAVCIGEETARELILRGRTAAVADAHTADALAAAVEREEFSCNG